MSTHELKVEETDDGELYFTIPQDVLDRLDWKEGDEIKFVENVGQNSFTLKKVRYENIEMEFTEDELYKFMLAAHERGQSFNEFVESAIKFKLALDREPE